MKFKITDHESGEVIKECDFKKLQEFCGKDFLLYDLTAGQLLCIGMFVLYDVEIINY